MSPQRSNRGALIDGALRCLEALPAERITARQIAAESGANLASIGYHFGSKDQLVTEAVITGLDRWLAEIEAGLEELETEPPAARLSRAAKLVERGWRERAGLSAALLVAVSRARHDEQVRARLAGGFRRTRPALARLLGLGADAAGEDAAGLIHSMFVGLLLQELIDPRLAIGGRRLQHGQARLRDALPAERGS